MPVSWTLSRARRAEEDLEYLQKTMPLDTIRSVLQYWRSLKVAISACGHDEVHQAQQVGVVPAAGILS